MSYVGSSAAVIPVGFSGVNSQSFNGDGSTVAFTLNRPVSAVNAIEVMVNNVQQSPYDGSYSVSSTTLTFSAAPSSGTANIYVVYRDFPVGSITDTSAVQKTGDTMTGNLIVDANVGIGTSSPNRLLSLYATQPVFQITNVASGNTQGTIQYQASGSTDFILDNQGSGSGGIIIFMQAGNERARIDSSGHLIVPAGITLGTAAGTYAAANTLDDYEEGTWTPSIGGTATYINQLGHYTKIGNFVKLRFHLEVNSLGTGSTTTITGIPFNPANTGPTIIGGNVCYAANLGTAVLALGVYIQSTGNIYFYTRNSSSTGATTQQPAVIANGFNVYCEVSYQV